MASAVAVLPLKRKRLHRDVSAAPAVILPRQALHDSRHQTLRQRVMGDETSESGDSSGDESAGSSADEYAEGLGLADARHCGEVVSSGFTFDEHPREEYFEQPKSAALAPAGGGLELSQSCARLARPGGSLRDLSNVLSRLEAVEEKEAQRQAEASKVRRQGLDARGQAARREALPTMRRQFGGGLQTNSSCSSVSPSGPGQPANQVVEESCRDERSCELEEITSSTPSSGAKRPIAELCAHCSCLEALRGRVEAAKANRFAGTATSTGSVAKLRHLQRSAAEMKETGEAALRLLRTLALVSVGPAELRATGLGRELARAAWQQHPLPEVANLSSCVLAKWRNAVRAAGAKVGAAGA